MGLFRKIAAVFVGNGLGLLAARYFVADFELEYTVLSVVSVTLVFTALNIILKPILKLLFGPLIILTLGIGLIGVNAALLYTLDIASKSLTIHSASALLYATLIISAANIVVHFVFKK